VTANLTVTGRIATLAGTTGLGWVEAIAIEDGSVVASGARAEVAAAAGRGTRRLDLEDDLVCLPGITDAHLHLVSAALAATQLDLTTSPGLESVLRQVRAAHEERLAAGDRSGWLLGRGWSRDQLGGWPAAGALESAAPGRPVVLDAHDGHGVWASAAALQAGGVSAASEEPKGGVILRDRSGQPSGVLLEAAAPLVGDAVPLPDDEDVAAALAAYGRRLAAVGIVGCHDPGESWAEPLRWVRLLARMTADGSFPMRTFVSVRRHELDAAIGEGLRSGAPLSDRPDGARFGWLKLFADGTLGSRTAAMLDPYLDASTEDEAATGAAGILVVPPEELSADAAAAAGEGIATQIHAIGDRAARVALDALEPVGHVDNAGLRPRLEHVQAIAPDDIRRMAAGGIVASVQPIHLRTDAPLARRAWADRLERAYPWRSVARAGVTLAFGSDAPIEAADPWAGIGLAVTRSDGSWGTDRPFGPDQGLDLPAALRAACLGPAEAANDSAGGRLLPGCRGDLIVVHRDALANPDGRLAAVRPVLTLIGGVAVHRDAAWDALP
jgi:predicted amidohydrolase YtcJ